MIKIGTIKKMIYSCMIFILIRPYGLYVKPQLDSFYRVGKIATLGCLLLHLGYFLVVQRNKTSRAFRITMLFFGVYLAAYLVNRKSITEYFNENIVFLAVCIWMELAFQVDRSVTMFSQPLQIVMTIYVSIELATRIIYPHGIAIYYNTNTVYWFLGTKNLSIRYIIPYLVVTLSHPYKSARRKKVMEGYAIISSVFITVITNSSTALMGLITFLLVYYLAEKKHKVIPLSWFLIADGLFYFVVIKFRLQNLFAFFIEGVLHKDLTFTNRTLMWENAFIELKGHYILGKADYNVLINAWRGKSHPHNYVLYTLLCGGILLLFCLCYMIVRASNAILATYEYALSRCLLCGIAAFLVMANTESLIGAYLFLPLIMVGGKLDEDLNQTARK